MLRNFLLEKVLNIANISQSNPVHVIGKNKVTWYLCNVPENISKWPKQNGPPKDDAFCQHHPAQLNLQKGQNYFRVKGRDIDQRIVDAADSVSVFCRQINDALTLEWRLVTFN